MYACMIIQLPTCNYHFCTQIKSQLTYNIKMLPQLSRNIVSLISHRQSLADFLHLKTLSLFCLSEISHRRPPFFIQHFPLTTSAHDSPAHKSHKPFSDLFSVQVPTLFTKYKETTDIYFTFTWILCWTNQIFAVVSAAYVCFPSSNQSRMKIRTNGMLRVQQIFRSTTIARLGF